jgi:hypothetical protein
MRYQLYFVRYGGAVIACNAKSAALISFELRALARMQGF